MTDFLINSVTLWDATSHIKKQPEPNDPICPSDHACTYYLHKLCFHQSELTLSMRAAYVIFYLAT